MESARQTLDAAPARDASHSRIFSRYAGLLRRNPHFRRLWMAQLVSEIGDWFYSLAVYDLLYRATHSAAAVGWAVIIQTLPWFLMTPFAGHIVDRFRRRSLMIEADVARGVVVLGLLLAGSGSPLWLVYALLLAEVLFASVFEPARSALLPNLVPAEEILAANALSSATWSTALAVGAALGGLVTALLGRQTAFVLNSASFFASALLIGRIVCRETHTRHGEGGGPAGNGASGIASIRQGIGYLRAHPKIMALATAKIGIGLLGGSLLLLTIFGERIFSSSGVLAGRGALAMGILYAARGVGAGLGPVAGDLLTRSVESRLWKSVSLCYLMAAVCYLGLSRAPNLLIAVLVVVGGHAASSTVWVTSTTLLQLHTDDAFRGRVFALDTGMVMLGVSVSNYLIGLGLDHGYVTARAMAALLGLVLVLPGALWIPVAHRFGQGNSE